MRKVKVWTVEFTQKGILEGCVNVVADRAEDAIEIARQAVTGDGISMFELTSIVPVLCDDRKTPFLILWVDEPSTGEVIQHEGKRYAPAAMPIPPEHMGPLSTSEDNPEEKTSRTQSADLGEAQALKTMEAARKELTERADRGEIVLFPDDKKKV